jgi:hypothetical protein
LLSQLQSLIILADSHGVTKFKVSPRRALLSNCIPGGPSNTKGEQAPQSIKSQ